MNKVYLPNLTNLSKINFKSVVLRVFNKGLNNYDSCELQQYLGLETKERRIVERETTSTDF